MANQSEKKGSVQRQQTIKYFQTVILIVTGFYSVNYLFRGDLFKLDTLLALGFFTLINYACYSSIEHRIRKGLESESYESQLDLLIVNSAIEFGTCFWSGFWYFYIIVPIYIFWKWILPYIKLFFMARSMGDQEVDESQLSNTQRKKREREKEGKEKVVYKKVK
ncbi:hypothetical protein ABPG74_012212 [Tetrahymena malaccensis]